MLNCTVCKKFVFKLFVSALIALQLKPLHPQHLFSPHGMMRTDAIIPLHELQKYTLHQRGDYGILLVNLQWLQRSCSFVEYDKPQFRQTMTSDTHIVVNHIIKTPYNQRQMDNFDFGGLDLSSKWIERLCGHLLKKICSNRDNCTGKHSGIAGNGQQ